MAGENKLKRVLESWFQAHMKTTLVVRQIEDWNAFITTDFRHESKKQDKLKNCVQYLKSSTHVPTWLKPHINEGFVSHFTTLMAAENIDRLNLVFQILSYHPWYVTLVDYEKSPNNQPNFEKTALQNLELQTCQCFMLGPSGSITAYSQFAGHMLHHAITFNYFDASVIPALRHIAQMNQASFATFLNQVIDGYSQVEVPNDEIRLFMRFMTYQSRPHPECIQVINAHLEQFTTLNHWITHSPITKCSVRTLEKQVTPPEEELDLLVIDDQTPIDALKHLAANICKQKIARDCHPEVLTAFYDRCNNYLTIHHEQLLCDIQYQKKAILIRDLSTWLLHVMIPCVLTGLMTLAQLNLMPVFPVNITCITIAAMALVLANFLTMINIKTNEVDQSEYTSALMVNGIGLFCVAIAYGIATLYGLPLLPMLSIAVGSMPLFAHGIWVQKIFNELDDKPLPESNDIQAILDQYHLSSVFRINEAYRLNFISLVNEGGQTNGCYT